MIRRFKNEHYPSVAVTVDLLTTGIDVPQICNLVFLRRVNSRILFDQMLGRATRLCDDVGKESFRIFDAVRIYEALENVTAMQPVAVTPGIGFIQLVQEMTQLPTEEARLLVRDQFVAKLQRKKRHLTEKAAQDFEVCAGMNPTDFIQHLRQLPPAEIAGWFSQHPGLGEILDRKTDAISPPVFISEHEDQLRDVTRGFGAGLRPEDYLQAFCEFINTTGNVSWEAPFVSKSRSGWHVIIGDNGSGKSTLLRAIALALIGPKNAEALRQDWRSWLSKGAPKGSVSVSVDGQAEDSFAGPGPKVKKYFVEAGVNFQRNEGRVELQTESFAGASPERHLWSEKPGWFAASFGPFRRFTGGDKDTEKLYFSHPRLARHLSVFGEDVALTECLAWLSQLRFEQLDNKKRSGALLDGIKQFINQEGFLPQGVTFESVDSKRVRFIDGNGVTVPVNVLGDGFRSILSLTFELLRQMAAAWNSSTLFTTGPDGLMTVKHSGVVLIDEIDAHLHPTWQRRIGFWLTRHFPKVQFIVTTHSPLVCHAAEKGSIFRLPTPGQKEKARMLTGLEKDRLIFGSVLDAYGTDLFGMDVSRSASL